MKKKNIIIYIILLIIILIGSIYYIIHKSNSSSTLSVDNIDTEINTDDGDEKINWDKYETKDITLTESLTITKGGIYNLSGNIKNGLITINTDDNVKLILNNVSITNESGPAIYIENAKNTVIVLSGENTLVDGSTYKNYDEDVNGTIYSKDDLIFDGDGTIKITANYQDGIVSKDDLKIINGTYIINSTDDGIRGKDSVYILNGNFTITSGGDGIKSTNDSNSEKGFILIEKGTFKIESELDGIQAETKLVINDGEFNIKTGDGSENSSTSNTSWGVWGAVKKNNNSTDNNSAKGLKSGNNLIIYNGTFNLDTSDDSIHSNSYVGIKDGLFKIASGDDGIHADTELIIDGGNINITKSYEGIESAKMTINNGTINIVSSDDGINVAGGNDKSSMNRPGENTYSNSSNILTINGGTIYIDTKGDGIDVNGNAYLNDGNITVEGPTDNGNGALDYDGVFEIKGGTLIAVGSSGMAQSATNSSTQYTVMINFSQTISSSDTVTITDSNGNEILSYKQKKIYTNLVFSSSKLQSNTTYTVKINGTTYQNFITNSVSTTVGSSQSNNQMNPDEGSQGNNQPMPGGKGSQGRGSRR